MIPRFDGKQRSHHLFCAPETEGCSCQELERPDPPTDYRRPPNTRVCMTSYDPAADQAWQERRRRRSS